MLEAHLAGQVAEWGHEVRLAWLRKALARNLTDELRRWRTDKRDIERERSLELALESSSANLVSWLAAEQSSPSQQAMMAEQLLHLADAVALLPETQREAIEKHYFQHLPVATIATQMGKSTAAVAGLLKRGLKELRRVLADMG